jgi:hypothetical protein
LIPQPRRFREEADARTQARAARPVHHDSVDPHLAARGRDQPAQHAQRRGLAGPVRAEQPEHLARLDLEIHVIDGRAVAEAAHEMGSGEHPVS